MARFVLLDCRIFNGGADLTSQSNKIELAGEVEDKDVTNFGSAGWKEVLAGLGSFAADGEGQWEAGDPSKVDDEAWAGLGGLGALTVCPVSASVGEIAWLSKAMKGQYALGGAIGDVAPWKLIQAGTWPLIRGKSLHPPGTARTASGDGTAVEHVAVATGQFLYAALHVLSVSGTGTPTLTAKIQSDTTGFPSPTDRINFTAATARTGEILRTAGPITDTFYRVSWTITGTSPSFLFIVSLGVGP